jgi:hypothetical protein
MDSARPKCPGGAWGNPSACLHHEGRPIAEDGWCDDGRRPAFTPEEDAAIYAQVERELEPAAPQLLALPPRPVLPLRGGDYRVSLALQDLHAAECVLASAEHDGPPPSDAPLPAIVKYRSRVALAQRDVQRAKEALRSTRMRALVSRMEHLRRPTAVKEAKHSEPPAKPVQLGLFGDESPRPPKPRKKPRKDGPVALAAVAPADELPEASPEDVQLVDVVEDLEGVPWAAPGDVMEVAA